ncbi:Flavin-dependent oxidoreductase, luciferase family (includes alkanesulfonate monooxygenase SsuD and methylene tetrahydromethanopterin reductase) [Rhodospirillales bacterium URHD0017]|nr:Flavin-dependent oxidoreductase, luciferase family (includes alkanesulfonate monooxygenase SsuD and methylene tetrahydromethanopterin reductase) [Rhodospirillales bacterium URHD0017]
MEFGVLFTSHPNPQEEPYPHRDVHQRTTDEVIEAERLGYDTAWIAEHHFATSYGIMPDCFAYMAYLAAKTSRIKIGAAVITLPLYDPIRVVENTSFVDILSNGRVRLGVGSGYRPYEFEGLGRDFDNRRDIVEESIGLMFDAWHRHRWDHKGKYYKGTVKEPYEMLPHPIQMPHPPLYMAGGTDRSIGYSGRNGFGLMLSTLPGIETLAAQTALYKRELATASAERRKNPAAGEIDIARWVYIADTDAAARAETEEAIVRHISHFGGSGTGGYLGSVSEKGAAIKYDDLASTLLHGSAETVIARLREMQVKTGMTSLLLHYPPYYGREKTMKSLRLFAERVIPAFRPPARRAAAE